MAHYFNPNAPANPMASAKASLWQSKEFQKILEEAEAKKNAIPPELLKMVLGNINQDQGTMDAWLQKMLGYTTGQLGGQLGANFARTNVAMPSGAQAIANRYLSPLGSLIEGNKPQSWADKMMQALSIGKTMTPAMSRYKKGGSNETDDLNEYLKMFLGGNKGGTFGGFNRRGRW